MHDQENNPQGQSAASVQPARSGRADIASIAAVPASELKGRKVLVRCDFNLPLTKDGKVIDDLRIRKTIPTISYLKSAGAKIVLISHIENKDGLGLEPVARHISEKYSAEFGILGQTFAFVSDFTNTEAIEKFAAMNDGDITLLENLRTSEGEKKNDAGFATSIKEATRAEIYVNDAFAVSHRAHASVVALPALFGSEKYAGVQMMNEIEHISLAFNSPRPFIFILGGAKFESKLPLIKKFSAGEKAADAILLGGALLNDVLKAKGYEVGKSLVSSGDIDVTDVMNNANLVIPTDVIVQEEGQMGSESSAKAVAEVLPTDTIFDVGPSITADLAEKIGTAKFILWNGPMGNYEKGFKDQTIAMAKLVAEASKKGGLRAILGGGDTTAAVAELGLDEDAGENMFVSTGGGAMLEYLLNESLPGIEALKKA